MRSDGDWILTRTNCNKTTNVIAQTFERRTDSETKIGDNVPSFRQKERTSSAKIRNLGGRNHHCPSSFFGKHCVRQRSNSKTLRNQARDQPGRRDPIPSEQEINDASSDTNLTTGYDGHYGKFQRSAFAVQQRQNCWPRHSKPSWIAS